MTVLLRELPNPQVDTEKLGVFSLGLRPKNGFAGRFHETAKLPS